MTPKSWATATTKVDKTGFSKIKNVCTSTDSIKRFKRQLNEIKYLPIIYMIKDLYLEYIKNPYNSIRKRNIIQLKMGKASG